MNIDKIIEENNYSPTPLHHMPLLVHVPPANNFHHYPHHHLHYSDAVFSDAPLSSSSESAVTATTPTIMQHQGEEEVRLRVLVQPDDVQVKRVGRASCIEPELKVSLETDSLYPQTVVINAYLKVLGKDNKHKLILLRKSDEILMTKVHRRETLSMKLRFLKTIKVQVLKRNLGVARPEASVIFEVVNRHGEVLSAQETTHFAIISDPRYLDEVKKRRVGERSGEAEVPESDEDAAYHPPAIVRALKRRRLTTGEYEGPVSSGYPLLSSGDISIKEEPCSPSSPCSSPESPSSPSFDEEAPISSPPIYLTPLQTLKSLSDGELFADSEEEYKLIKLVESLKYRGCGQQHYNFQVLPFELPRGHGSVCM